MRQTLLASIFCALICAGAARAGAYGRFFGDGDTGEKIVALTFDDGPSVATGELLDLLDRAQVRATFFLLGKNVRRRPEVARAIADRGHELANHTDTHINFSKYKGDDFRMVLSSEIAACGAAINAAAGTTPSTIRMPHGYLRSWVREVAQEAGVDIVHWSFGCDWKKMSAEEMGAAYIKALRPGAIFLFHDTANRGAVRRAALEALIEAAHAQGYRFVLITDLLKNP